jgi:hypothetical protein
MSNVPDAAAGAKKTLKKSGEISAGCALPA